MYYVKKAEKIQLFPAAYKHTADMNFTLKFYLWFQDQSKHAVSFLNPKTKYLQQDVLELFNPRDVVLQSRSSESITDFLLPSHWQPKLILVTTATIGGGVRFSSPF